MPSTAVVNLASLRGTDPDLYVQAEAYVVALLQELWPDRDFTVGRTLYWNVVVPLAMGMTATRQNGLLVTDGLYLQSIRELGSAAPEDLVNRLLSNYYVQAQTGAVSSGTVSVVVSRNASLSLPAGTVFATSQNQYVTTTPIFVYTSSSLVSGANDRLLTALQDGTYSFSVPVQSGTTGYSTVIPLGTSLAMPTPLQSFVRAFAASDIAGGVDAKSALASIGTVPEKFAASTFGSKANVSALLAEQYPNMLVGTVGFGDPEMTRDTHNLIGVSTGGMVDLYIRPQASLSTTSLTVTASLTDLNTRTWQFTLTGLQADGVYGVAGIQPAGATADALTPTSVTRAVQVEAGRYDPLIATAEEAAFSSYQALTVQFVDEAADYTGLSVGASKSYTAQLYVCPLVRDVQNFLSQSKMLTGADKVLVRGAVPCITNITVQVRLLDADQAESLDVAAIKSAIVSRVAQVGFGFGTLSSSAVMSQIMPYLTGRSDIHTTSVVFAGQVLAPTGETLVLGGPELTIPEEPTKMVSKRNTVFLTDVTKVEVQFTRIEA
jgi:hypothetical protein